MTRRLLLPLFLLLFVAVAAAATSATDASLTNVPAAPSAEEAVDHEPADDLAEALPTVLPELQVDRITGSSCFADCIDAYDICLWSCTIRGGACHDACIDERTACLASCG